MRIKREQELPAWHTDTEIEEEPPGKDTSILAVICTILIAAGAALLAVWFLFVLLMSVAVNNAG